MTDNFWVASNGRAVESIFRRYWGIVIAEAQITFKMEK
jgi:hypothetical protein